MFMDSSGCSATLVVAGITFTVGEVIVILVVVVFCVAYAVDPKFRKAVNDAISWAVRGVYRSVTCLINRYKNLGKWAATLIAAASMAMVVANADAKIQKNVKRSRWCRQ